MRWKRLIGFWLLSFLSVYAVSLLMVWGWMNFGYNNLFLIVGSINAPIVTLLWSWLYFLGVRGEKLSDRLHTAMAWVALDYVGTVLLFLLLSIPVQDAFAPASYFVEGANVIAILVAGYVAASHAPAAAADTPSTRLPKASRRSSGPRPQAPVS